MEEKNKAVVIALKNKDGHDILGYYLGESTIDDGAHEPCIILYRPIYVHQSVQLIKNIPVTSYATSMYFRYGTQAVNIPYSHILCYDQASEFFTLFYTRSIGDLIAREENVNESYLKFFINKDIKEAMKNTDSLFVDHTTEFLQ